MKQTAVEWLINEIKIARKLCDDPSIDMDIWYTLDVLISKGEEAKEMEKEQHEETFNRGVQWMQYHRDLVYGGVEYWDKEPSYFLEYYNKTFNTNEK